MDNSNSQRSAHDEDDEPRSEVVAEVGHYAIVPEWLLTADISSRAVHLYGHLALMANHQTHDCWPRRKLLAERLRCSLATLDRTMNELETIKAVVTEPRYNEHRQRSNVYRLRITAPGGDSSMQPPPLTGEAPPTHARGPVMGTHPRVGGGAHVRGPKNQTHVEPNPKELDTGPPPQNDEPHVGAQIVPLVMPPGATAPLLGDSRQAMALSPGHRAKVATQVLDAAHPPEGPQLTSSERKKLRQSVEEWLEVGHQPEDIAKAISASPYKTGPAVGGQLHRAQGDTGRRRSVGDDTLAAIHDVLAEGSS